MEWFPGGPNPAWEPNTPGPTSSSHRLRSPHGYSHSNIGHLPSHLVGASTDQIDLFSGKLLHHHWLDGQQKTKALSSGWGWRWVKLPNSSSILVQCPRLMCSNRFTAATSLEVTNDVSLLLKNFFLIKYFFSQYLVCYQSPNWALTDRMSVFLYRHKSISRVVKIPFQSFNQFQKHFSQWKHD